MKRSKRYTLIKSKVDRSKLYNVKEALSMLREISKDESSKVKFDETIDIAFNLNLKAKHTIRDTMILPYPVKKVEKKY